MMKMKFPDEKLQLITPISLDRNAKQRCFSPEVKPLAQKAAGIHKYLSTAL